MDIEFEEVEEGICDFGDGAIEFCYTSDIRILTEIDGRGSDDIPSSMP